MQDILYTIKRTNLQIMDIEEVLETKGRDNLFSNITTENFPNLKKESNMQVQKAFKTPRWKDKKKKTRKVIILNRHKK